MAVSTTTAVSGGLYVPFHQKSRGDGYTPVGTLYVDGGATGAAGGGTVSIAISMRALEFGFRLAWVITQMSISDNLGTAEVVELSYQAAGNRRINSAIVFAQSTLDAGAQDGALLEIGAIPIEGVSQTQGDVFKAQWQTNTDTKSYHLHAFGPVYDLELIAQSGRVPPLLAGIR